MRWGSMYEGAVTMETFFAGRLEKNRREFVSAEVAHSFGTMTYRLAMDSTHLGQIRKRNVLECIVPVAYTTDRWAEDFSSPLWFIVTKWKTLSPKIDRKLWSERHSLLPLEFSFVESKIGEKRVCSCRSLLCDSCGGERQSVRNGNARWK